ncbi:MULTISPECIES: helix-turn-helix domain-containing protein [Acidiphilium]|uniref:Transcriptional regulator, XRE family n=1 Tax=Acidiphilium cryptum (strain JF-5) TaxID=349163 RepID=A5FT41_ACICJ|nr:MULTISPECIES: helix-turn-helix domain-containing protein [Acidiphilium]OYV54373.1 MAG: transcriptional regulator [Acidiphilium sp. 20-67-58]OYV67722.1 MAG: transcriptional regulator [Acidiphilium sp. 21-66-27]HQT94986.1 helix-turn-helix transcriptional regulator [Thermoanaerobaculaceae bacterium]ABQ28773.1 transcriptional regulator, XRE family [Acidiphilium cryptum JF-5]ABQ28815.1 transcriptional regulator, XRE family [Acidiphilium cryptum JF-5]
MDDRTGRPRNIVSLQVASLDAHIGGQITARRAEIGLSRRQLAMTLRVPVRGIAAYERGIQHVAPADLFRLAQALGVDLAYFYTDSASSPQAPKAETGCPVGGRAAGGVGQAAVDMRQYDDIDQIADRFSRIRNPAIRRCVTRMLDSLAEHEVSSVTVGDVRTEPLISAFEELAELAYAPPSASRG